MVSVKFEEFLKENEFLLQILCISFPILLEIKRFMNQMRLFMEIPHHQLPNMGLHGKKHVVTGIAGICRVLRWLLYARQ